MKQRSNLLMPSLCIRHKAAEFELVVFVLPEGHPILTL